jgi:hypothetical protein
MRIADARWLLGPGLLAIVVSLWLVGRDLSSLREERKDIRDQKYREAEYVAARNKVIGLTFGMVATLVLLLWSMRDLMDVEDAADMARAAAKAAARRSSAGIAQR